MCCSPLLASTHWLRSDISCCYFGAACCQGVVASHLGVAKVKWKVTPLATFRSRWKIGCFLQLPYRSTSSVPNPPLTDSFLKSLLSWVENRGTHSQASLIWLTTVSGSRKCSLCSTLFIFHGQRVKDSENTTVSVLWQDFLSRYLSGCRRPELKL